MNIFQRNKLIYGEDHMEPTYEDRLVANVHRSTVKETIEAIQGLDDIEQRLLRFEWDDNPDGRFSDNVLTACSKLYGIGGMKRGM